MNTIKTFLLLPALFLALAASAQEEAPFNSDRPGAINGTEILPKGRLQWETAVQWERSEYDDISMRLWTINSSVIRYGLTDYAEMQLRADYMAGTIDGEHRNGFANVSLGAKVRLFDGWRFLPSVTMLSYLMVPDKKDTSFMPDNWSLQWGLCAQHDITRWLSFGYEGSLLWLDDKRPTPYWGFSLGFQLSDKWLLMADQYNWDYSGDNENWVELSLCWHFAKRMQVDVYSDFNLRYLRDYTNIGVGFSWQLTK